MSGKFISLIIAASMAVTGLTATPAQANNRDLALALAAIAGVAVVGKVIHDSNKSDRRKREAAQKHYNNHRYHNQRPYYAQPKRNHRPHHAKPQRHHKAQHNHRHTHRAHYSGPHKLHHHNGRSQRR